MKKPLIRSAVILSFLVLSVILLEACSSSQVAGLEAQAGDKKLIQIDWNPVSPNYMANNLPLLESKPFDGIIVSLGVSGDIFRKTPYLDSAYSSDQADLATVKDNTTKLTSNFIRIDTRHEAGWNWLDDNDWTATKKNIENFALTAKAGGFKGFFFDTEAYGFSPWIYTPDRYQGKSFDEVAAIVRESGKDFMNLVQWQIPDVVLIFSWSLSVPYLEQKNGEDITKSGYALLVPFIEGMIEVAGPGVTFVDGNEYAYDYAFASEYDTSVTNIENSKSILEPSLQAKFASQSRVAQSVYVDGVMNIYTSPRFLGFFFANDAERVKKYEHSVYHALRTSDEYVWVYSERPEWWTNTLTSGLEAAQSSAANKIKNGQPLGFDEGFISTAKTAFDKRIIIFGKVTDAAGKGLPQAVLNSGFTFQGREATCATFGTDGNYTCIVPFGWSGTITPTLAGKTFTPASRTYSNVGSNPDDLNGLGPEDYTAQ
jgi:hypothetical protein